MIARPPLMMTAFAMALIAGCEPEPMMPTPASTTATADVAPLASVATSAEDAAAARARRLAKLDAEPRERVSLYAIPFTVEAPKSWMVQPGPANKTVLHGEVPGGEVDVLLTTGPKIVREALDALVKQSGAPATVPAGVRTQVGERDGIQMIRQVEIQAAATSDPELIPVRWTLQCIVPSGIDFQMYELNVVGMSKAMFERDEAFVQSILDTLRLDAAATRPAMP